MHATTRIAPRPGGLPHPVQYLRGECRLVLREEAAVVLRHHLEHRTSWLLHPLPAPSAGVRPCHWSAMSHNCPVEAVREIHRRRWAIASVPHRNCRPRTRAAPWSALFRAPDPHGLSAIGRFSRPSLPASVNETGCDGVYEDVGGGEFGRQRPRHADDACLRRAVVECALAGRQDQAAVLTESRAC